VAVFRAGRFPQPRPADSPGLIGPDSPRLSSETVSQNSICKQHGTGTGTGTDAGTGTGTVTGTGTGTVTARTGTGAGAGAVLYLGTGTDAGAGAGTVQVRWAGDDEGESGEVVAAKVHFRRSRMRFNCGPG